MSWFVVATKPNSENLATAHLARQGFAPYVPQIKTIRRHARKVEAVKRALFPGYIFVELDQTVTRWRSINGTVGVKHILTCAGQPQALDNAFVAALMAREVDGVIPEEYAFSTGELVSVVGGPFDAHIGKIISADHMGRVRLLMSMLGGDVVSLVPVEKLQRVG